MSQGSMDGGGDAGTFEIGGGKTENQNAAPDIRIRAAITQCFAQAREPQFLE